MKRPFAREEIQMAANILPDDSLDCRTSPAPVVTTAGGSYLLSVHCVPDNNRIYALLDIVIIYITFVIRRKSMRLC